MSANIVNFKVNGQLATVSESALSDEVRLKLNNSGGGLTQDEVEIMRAAISQGGIGWYDTGEVLCDATLSHGSYETVTPANLILQETDEFSLLLFVSFDGNQTKYYAEGRDIQNRTDGSGNVHRYLSVPVTSSINVIIDYWPELDKNTYYWYKSSGSGTPSGTRNIKVEGPVVFHRIDGHLID